MPYPMRRNALMDMSGNIDRMQNDAMGGFGQSNSPSADRYLSGIGQPLANYSGQRQAMDEDNEIAAGQGYRGPPQYKPLMDTFMQMPPEKLQQAMQDLWDEEPTDMMAELIDQVAKKRGVPPPWEAQGRQKFIGR